MAREGRAAFLSERIAGAQHFDIDEVADQTSPFPHMVPSEADFQEHVEKVSHFFIPSLLSPPLEPGFSTFTSHPLSPPHR